MHETQEGDPRKAAGGGRAALGAERTPLRLQLGADSVAMVRAHAETLLADLKTWEPVALATRVSETA
jgi:hypothetical protein